MLHEVAERWISYHSEISGNQWLQPYNYLNQHYEPLLCYSEHTHRGNYRMTTAYILLKKTSIRKEKQTCETAPHQNTQRNQTTDKDTRRSSKNHPTHPQPGLLGTHHPRCRPWGRPGAWLRGTWRRTAAPGCGPGSRSSSAPRWPELPAECWRGEDGGIKDELQPRGGVSVKIQVAQCETLSSKNGEEH